MDWYQWKLLLEHGTGASMDSLHVILGVILQLGIAALMRLPVSRLYPWLAVLGIELANELNDLRVEVWPDPGMQYGEGLKDIVLTMFLPTIILIASRRMPHLLTARASGAPTIEDRSEGAAKAPADVS